MNEEMFEKIAEDAYADEMSKVASTASNVLRSFKNLKVKMSAKDYKRLVSNKAKKTIDRTTKRGKLIQRMVDSKHPGVKRGPKSKDVNKINKEFIDNMSKRFGGSSTKRKIAKNANDYIDSGAKTYAVKRYARAADNITLNW